MGRQIASTLDLDEVLQRIAVALVESFGYYHTSIFVVDEPAGEIVLRARAGQGGEPAGLRLAIGDVGITGWVAAHGKHLLAGDVSKEPRYRFVESLKDTRSELAVPIVSREGVIGVIDIQSTHIDAFEDEDLFALQALADQTAAAIMNARLYEQARQQASDLKLLYEAARLFSSTLDREKVLEEISRLCVDALGVDLALVRLIEGDELVARGSYFRDPAEKLEIEKRLRDDPIKVGIGIAGQVAATGEPAASGRRVPLESLTLPSYVSYLKERRWLVVPLKAGDRIIGVLTFIARGVARSFTPRELALAQGIANVAAVAIENARLFQEAREKTEAMQWSEEQFRTLFDGVPVGLYRSTPEGRILSANSALVRMLGYPDLTTLLGANAADLYAVGDDREVWRDSVDRAASSSGATTVRLRRFDGTIIWAQDIARVVHDETGHVQFYEGSLQDITERKALEEQLRQSQKMEAVGRLAGGIAHDFNNILTSIRGYVELALMSLRAEDPVAARLRVIEREAERASTVTRQLLTFSRRQLLEMKVVDINEVVRNLSKLLERTIGETIRLSTSLSDTFSMLVMADASAIQQIMLNLCLNARDAMPNGGTLTLSTRAAIFDSMFAAVHPWATPGHYVVLSVADTGIGMDKHTQEHAFEPFFTTKEGGTGLGLAMVYGLAQQHRGFVHLTSAKGHGTIFEIYIPRHLEKSEAVEPLVEAQIESGGTETILVAEDEEVVRNLLQSILEEQGYTVLTAVNGREALRVFEAAADSVDLVLLDMVMPEMGGRRVYQLLCDRRPKLKFLFMSGYSMEEDTSAFLEKSGVQFMRKPFTPAEVAQKTREVLDTQRGLPATE